MAPKLELTGILPAMITPFTEGGVSIDTAALTSQVERLIAAGVGGLIPGGSTGEFTALSRDERKLLHSTVLAAAAGRVPVVPHTGAATAAEAIELSQHAEQHDAAAVMVIPPYYDTLSFAELHRYYSDVAGNISIPVMLYHMPAVSGQGLTPAQIGELALIPGVAAMKDSSGDAAALTELIENYGDRIQVCNGWDSLTFFGLAAGAKASVWGAANIFPELAVELYDAMAVKGDLDTGRAIWSRIFPLVAFLEAESYGQRVKAAVNLLGVPAGEPRLPFLPASESDVAALRKLMDEAGLL
ncbi:dihydrodipicolinate synthase family protein [Kribbella sp. NPDC050124]|uniref:dihydrodipicolinate synthase family protein n=1 Tax=Kribbella sp. NPDC050124 TaxID=3364114 RepID=UPI0037A663C8